MTIIKAVVFGTDGLEVAQRWEIRLILDDLCIANRLAVLDMNPFHLFITPAGISREIPSVLTLPHFDDDKFLLTSISFSLTLKLPGVIVGCCTYQGKT